MPIDLKRGKINDERKNYFKELRAVELRFRGFAAYL